MSMSLAKLSKPEVVGVYSQTAFIYDVWGRLTETTARQRSLALAQIRDGEAVLEVAVGTGLTFQEILHANPHGTNLGIDLTPAMLAQAKRKAAKREMSTSTLSVGDAYHLPVSDHQCDIVINNYMFDLLPEADFPVVLREFQRVLKPGGRIVLVNMTKAEHMHQHVWEAIYHLNPAWLGGCRGVVVAPVMQAMGFTDIHRETASQLGFPSEIITARV